MSWWFAEATQITTIFLSDPPWLQTEFYWQDILIGSPHIVLDLFWTVQVPYQFPNGFHSQVIWATPSLSLIVAFLQAFLAHSTSTLHCESIIGCPGPTKRIIKKARVDGNSQNYLSFMGEEDIFHLGCILVFPLHVQESPIQGEGHTS